MGGCLPRWRVCLPRACLPREGVSTRGGGCLPRAVHLPPLLGRQTIVADGKNRIHTKLRHNGRYRISSGVGGGEMGSVKNVPEIADPRMGVPI